MTSCSQTQCDLAAISVSSPQTTTGVSVGLSPAVVSHNATDEHISFPFMPLHVPLLHTGDFNRNQENLLSPYAYDLNMPFDMNAALDQDSFFSNNIPFMDYQSSDFSSSGFDVTMGFGTSSSMMNNYEVQNNSFPDLESTSNANLVSFASASRGGVGNFHTTPNFSGSSVRRSNSDIISGAHDNQVGVNAPQIGNVDEFDGRFLSLGCQSAVNTKSSAYREFPSHMCESPFSPRVQQGNYSHVRVGERLTGFPNSFQKGGSPMDMCGNSTFAQSDLQAMTSASSVPSDPMLLGGQVNMHHLMVNPRRKMPQLKEETGLRISSSDASEGQMRTAPFNSSVLRSNHQNSANSLKEVYVRSNKVLSLPEETSEVAKQDKSGTFSPNVASYVGAAEHCKMSDDRVPQAANERGAVTIEDQISHSSTQLAKGRPKRSFDSTQQTMTHYQRRKVTAQSSSHQFSSHLLQNALGQISSSQSMPLCPISGSSSLEGIVYNDSTLNPTPLTAPSRIEGPTVTQMFEHQAGFPGSAMSSFLNASSMPVAPPISAADPAALPRNVTRRIDYSRIFDPASGRVSSMPVAPPISAADPAALPRNVTCRRIDYSRILDRASGRVSSVPVDPPISAADPAALPRNVTCRRIDYSRIIDPASGRVSSMPVAPPISAADPAALPRNVTCRRIDYSRILDPASGRVSSMPVAPPISAADPAALPRNVTRRRIDYSPILDSASGRLASGCLPLLNNNRSPVTIPSNAYLSRTNSNLMATPTVAPLRKPPHALTTPVKASPPYLTQQSTAMVPHIKWQVSEPILGLKCMLCKRDLSYAPEGPISIPPVPPHVAVLPCGHSFHDHCLLLITPNDQSKDPPCIPCAIGDS